MKRITQGLLATVISLSCMGAAVGAESGACDGDISGTGNGSTNEVTCTDTTKVSVICKNGIYVLNDNDQTSSSGDVDGKDNTSVGDVSTGNAVNENGTVVEIGASCGEAQQPIEVVTPPTPGKGSVSTPSSVTPGMGSLAGGTGSVVVPTNAPVEELPNTASNPVAAAATIGTIGLASLFGLSRLALYGYGRYLTK